MNPQNKKIIIGIVVVAILVFGAAVVFDYNRFRKQESVEATEQAKKPSSDAYLEDREVENNARITTVQNVDGLRGYEIRFTVLEELYESELQILKDQKSFFRLMDYRFTPAVVKTKESQAKKEINFLETAQDFVDHALFDVTGDGLLELVFKSWGGGKCSNNAYVVELSNPPKEIINLDLNCADLGGQFEDLDGDGSMEIKSFDTVFGYWYTDGVTSPAPGVILSLDKNKKRYFVDANLMRKTPPSQKELEAKAGVWTIDGWNGHGEDCEKWPDGGVSCRIPWSYALDLLYSGNTEVAVKYINLAWRDNDQFSSKAVFWEEFKKTLKESQFYEEISSKLIDFSKLP